MSWPLTTLTSEASTFAMLTLGFGFATFSVAARIGRMAAAAWWDEKLQEARKPFEEQKAHAFQD
jgi:hypothetical protein